ncbi:MULTISPECIES: response regulator transcription factor [unclassified Fusibacter]|uniref:response regulator transcription factor n=1 Tax=unclassified Fusibacter TaxID=2624464 RepID=UPI001011B6E6|nr:MULTISPECIES: response regulator transcription factor [unclassified Fusibacter]MCK8059205.1 response regulator transcription factor [Fusibacter sp. A2]NPE21333.1 response regulator transcription factor [Fusibacter sp. A1]RXV62594.1 DNA-binding response regulator [Fusibacter sp. A1]
METKHRILIIEDEEKITRFLQLELEYEGYEVAICYDGKEGLDYYKEHSADLILLDVMMPRMNGMEVCRRVRQFSDVPIIMLTAKDDTMDKVTGLDTGADDYVTKPFAIEELLARMRAHLKKGRGEQTPKNQLLVKNVLLDIDKHIVTYQGQIIELTKKEFDLLRFLMANKNIVISREKILEEVWGYDFIGDTNVVDVYIRYLRSKIDDVFDFKLIHTVRGVGYTIKDENF